MNRIVFGFVVTLLLFALGACAPVAAPPPTTATASPPTATTVPTNQPTDAPPSATNPPTAVPPTAASSPSPVPPTDTATASPVPPTAATVQPTHTPPPPTATLPPPTATKAAPKPTAVPATTVPQPTSPPSGCPLDPGNAGIFVVNDFDGQMTFTILNHEYKIEPHASQLVQIPGDTKFTASVSVVGVGKTSFGPYTLSAGQCVKYEPHAG
jgi:hypothetical protein